MWYQWVAWNWSVKAQIEPVSACYFCMQCPVMPSNAFADKNVKQSATCGIAVPASFVMKMPISHYFLVSDRHCDCCAKAERRGPIKRLAPTHSTEIISANDQTQDTTTGRPIAPAQSLQSDLEGCLGTRSA